MNWLQIALLFLIWIAFGFFLKFKSEVIRTQLLSKTRSFRVGLGIFGFILAAVSLFVGLVAVSQSPALYSKGNLSFLGFLVVVISGGGFVLLQVLAASSAILLAIENVTSETRGTSPLSQGKMKQKLPNEMPGDDSPEPDKLTK